MSSQPSRKVRSYLYVLSQRSKLLEKHLLNDEVDDFILEMLDFVWNELGADEHEAVTSLMRNEIQTK